MCTTPSFTVRFCVCMRVCMLGRGVILIKKNNRNDCEPSCLFVILHQQWRGHTIPSFTGETPGNEHIVNINI